MRYNREKKELTFDEAKDKALRLLEFRSHSERELSDKLKRAGAAFGGTAGENCAYRGPAAQGNTVSV